VVACACVFDVGSIATRCGLVKAEGATAGCRLMRVFLPHRQRDVAILPYMACLLFYLIVQQESA